jgi:hypothetical protein
MTQEALKLALEALDAMANEGWLLCGPEGLDNAQTKCVEAITAIKEALREHAMREVQRIEQEPVAWINVEERKLEWAKPMSWNTPTTVNIPKIPLYTTPPQRTWVDLTDTQIEQAYFEVVQEHRGAPMPWGQVQFGRALLDKFKEVNT